MTEAGKAGADFAGRRSDLHDVLVVGGGPAGTACAYWLAEAGWDVVLTEKKRYPRDKTCGDGLTPRSVRQLDDMGLSGALAGAHRYSGLRTCAFGRSLEMAWPEHPSFPSHGYVITRRDLDQLVAERAQKAGARVIEGCEATEPILREAAAAAGGIPALAGARLKTSVPNGEPSTHEPPPTEIRARYVVVADGSNSRFGRALGTSRDRHYPMGMALRGYYTSPRHDDPFIESHLDLRDENGAMVPGYGWIFPLGDGRVNVGVGLLTVSGRWKGLNTSRLLDAFVADAPESWGLAPEGACGPATGGKLPMGFAVGPVTGPNVLVIGDASGCINPFNGEGIAYGYETGRLAAACLGRALSGGGESAVRDYETRLASAYGSYYRVARAFVTLISNPQVLRACMLAGMSLPPMMNGLLRIMSNLMRPEPRLPEAAFGLMEAVGRIVP